MNNVIWRDMTRLFPLAPEGMLFEFRKRLLAIGDSVYSRGLANAVYDTYAELPRLSDALDLKRIILKIDSDGIERSKEKVERQISGPRRIFYEITASRVSESNDAFESLETIVILAPLGKIANVKVTDFVPKNKNSSYREKWAIESETGTESIAMAVFRNSSDGHMTVTMCDRRGNSVSPVEGLSEENALKYLQVMEAGYLDDLSPWEIVMDSSIVEYDYEKAAADFEQKQIKAFRPETAAAKRMQPAKAEAVPGKNPSQMQKMNKEFGYKSDAPKQSREERSPLADGLNERNKKTRISPVTSKNPDIGKTLTDMISDKKPDSHSRKPETENDIPGGVLQFEGILDGLDIPSQPRNVSPAKHRKHQKKSNLP